MTPDDDKLQEVAPAESSSLMLFVALGAVGGGLLGWLWPTAAGQVGLLGDLWLRALQMLVVPLIVASMVHGVANVGGGGQMRGIGKLTVGYYLLTSSLALCLGLAIVNWLEPGVGIDISGASAPENVARGAQVGFRQMLSSLISPNLIRAAADTDLLPLILFSVAFGAVLPGLGEPGQSVLRFFDGTFLAIMKLVKALMRAAPVGVFGLVAGRLGQAGGGDAIVRMLAGLGLFVVAVVLGLLLHVVVVLLPLLWFVARRRPLVYLGQTSSALMTAFASASSSATLPVSLRCAEDSGVDPRAARLVLPLGATVNMDGSALYEAVAAVFIAQAWGLELGLTEQVLVFVTAILSSIGAAGIPEAGLVTMVIVLQAVGLPLEGLGLLVAIDWFLDRFRTAVNVAGDLVGVAVVERFGRVDRAQVRS